MKKTLYLDESGDHNLTRIDNNFPVISIAGCIFENDYYQNSANILINNLKKKYWKTEDVILVSSRIREQEGSFSILQNESIRHSFYQDINRLILDLEFKIICCVVFKVPHVEKNKDDAINPYSLSLDILMERFHIDLGVADKGAIVAESRGRKENEDLKEEFNRCKQIGTYYQNDFANIEYIRIDNKKENINGLQIADLVAYPIGYKLVYPNRINPAYEVIKEKFWKNIQGETNGYGLIVVPWNYREYQIDN